MTYHLDGSPNTQTDQRGVVHTYQYDDNRRVELDRVTTIPGGVDGTVKSIGRTYDEFGRVDTVTSYANDNGTGTIRNQIDYDFNTYGKVASTWQSHEGAVVKAGTPTPKMSYTYDSYAESNILVQGLRSHFTDYPDGRRFRDYYGNQSHQTFNRFQRMHQVSHISEPGGTHYLDAVKYAGVSRLMGYRHRVGSTILSVNHDSNNGHDRFGRVKNMLWGSSGSPKSQTQHTYDYAGNRLSRDVHGTTAYDQSYVYDGLQRLISTDQGNWNGSTITGKNFEEDHTLDQLGNWENLTRTDGTSTTLDQDRTYNAANEMGTIDVWQNPAHDAAGNMTTIPQPKAPASGYAAKYDAWNRLIKLYSGTDVQVNGYDGLHRRIVRDETGGSGDKRHFYYNEKWQCMEERVEVGGTIDPDPIKQYVYFPFYIDAVASVLYDPDTDGANIVRYDYLHDANFNVVAIITGTTSFDVVERYHYSPYGEVTILNGASDLNDMGGDWSLDADQVSDIGNEFLYTGRRLDPETGLYQFRYRYYHAQLGRFTTQDPIGYRGGMNLYEYVAGLPTNYADPLGLQGWSPHGPRPPGYGSPMRTHSAAPTSGPYAPAEDKRFSNCNREQEAILKRLESRACSKIAVTLHVLENQFSDLQEDPSFKNPGMATSELVIGGPNGPRAKDLIPKLRKALERCRKGALKYDCCPKPSSRCRKTAETMAYTMETLGISHATTNLCNTFWGGLDEEKLSVIIHEMGRQQGYSLDGSGNAGSDFTEEIGAWDGPIENINRPDVFDRLHILWHEELDRRSKWREAVR